MAFLRSFKYFQLVFKIKTNSKSLNVYKINRLSKLSEWTVLFVAEFEKSKTDFVNIFAKYDNWSSNMFAFNSILKVDLLRNAKDVNFQHNRKKIKRREHLNRSIPTNRVKFALKFNEWPS